MGTSYPTSRQTVVCRCALPRAVSAQFMVLGVVFSVCWFSSNSQAKLGASKHLSTRLSPINFARSTWYTYALTLALLLLLDANQLLAGAT